MIKRCWLVLVPVILAFLAATTGTASAHAVLEGSTPADGSRVASSPKQVTLRFDEPVSPVARDTRVLDSSQRTVSTSVTTSDSSTMAISLRPNLPTGTYLVQFRVISADTHPVSGTVSFGVRVTPGANAAAAAPAPKAPRDVGITLDALKVLGWVALILLIAVPAVWLLLWPASPARDRVRRLVWGGWALAYLSLIGTVLVRGPSDAAEGLGSMFDGGLLHATLASRTGGLLEAQAVLLTLALPVLWALFPRIEPQPGTRSATPYRTPARPGDQPALPWLIAGGLVGVGLWVTTAMAGHAGAGYAWPLWTAITTVHLAATAGWLAGLTMLAVVVLRRSSNIAVRNRRISSWSRVAMVCVALLVVSGVLQALRSIDSFGEVFGTPYGRLLVAKLCLVALMLLLGGLGRRWVRRLGRREGTGEPRLLRRQVSGELALGVAVLAVTSALSTTAPAKNTYSPALHRTVQAAQVRVRVDIPHTRRGEQKITLHFTDAAGRPLRPAQVTGSFSEDQKVLGPLPANFRLVPGENVARGGTEVLVPGTWRLRIIVRTGEFSAGIADLRYQVR